MDPLLDEAPCGFVIFNDKGVIAAANRTLGRWLERTPEELEGTKFDALMPVAGRIFFQTHFFPLMTLHGRAEEIFLTLRNKSGGEVPALLNARRKEGAGAFEIHCALMPVPQRQQYEAGLLQGRKDAEETILKNAELQRTTEALERSRLELDLGLTQLSHRNEELLQFSKVVSHDMQEPARKVAMFMDIMLRDPVAKESPAIRLAADRITAASARMRTLIGCLEQYVNVDVAPGPAGVVDLNSVIESARLRVAAACEGIPVAVQLEALPPVLGRARQLETLFQQLIANAVQFRKKEQAGPQIRISAGIMQYNRYRSLKDKYEYVDFIRITVEDGGVGFPQEYAGYIFELFRKAHQDVGGHGFGLSLCKKIVESHGGTITARSAPGEGATFTILLPAP